MTNVRLPRPHEQRANEIVMLVLGVWATATFDIAMFDMIGTMSRSHHAYHRPPRPPDLGPATLVFYRLSREAPPEAQAFLHANAALLFTATCLYEPQPIEETIDEVVLDACLPYASALDCYGLRIDYKRLPASTFDAGNCRLPYRPGWSSWRFNPDGTWTYDRAHPVRIENPR